MESKQNQEFIPESLFILNYVLLQLDAAPKAVDLIKHKPVTSLLESEHTCFSTTTKLVPTKIIIAENLKCESG